MTRKPFIWAVLARAVLIETLRRKDIYVVLILALLIVAGAGTVGFFGFQGIEVFAKDLGFGVISSCSAILCILVAGRQIPEEQKQRTLYPMLSRPISRFDFLIGKFLGSFMVSSLSFLMLTAVSALAMAYFRISLGGIVWQYILLKLFGLWLITGITMTLSLFITQSANIVLSILLVFGASTLSRGMIMAYPTAGPFAQWLNKIIYVVLPHPDLFDIGKKVAYGYNIIPWWVVAALGLYALLYAGATLMIGWFRFRKQAV